jgi:C4-dicarboxylate-binding protein DctP
MKSLVTCLIAGVLVSAAQPALARCDTGETIIRFSHDVDTDRHPKGVAATQLAERVNREMDGLACMQVYPFSSLAKEDDVIKAVIKGDVEMAAPALSRFIEYAGGFRVFQMPFMFRDLDAVQTFQRSSTGARLKQSMVPAGIQGLTYWQGGMNQLSTREQLQGPADSTLRIGTSNGGVNEKQLSLAGFNPVVTKPDGFFAAASAGRVDAVEATWADMYRYRLHKTNRFATVTNHGVDGYLLITSTKFWTDLKPKTRDALWSVLWSLTEERNQKVVEQEAINQARVRNAGVSIAPLDDAQRAQWVRRFEPTWSDRVK